MEVKTITITVQQARELVKLPEWKEIIEANFSPEELEEAVTWEKVIKQRKETHWIAQDSDIITEDFLCSSTGIASYKNSLPSREAAERELARMQVIMLADYYNGWKEVDWSDGKQKFYAYYDRESNVIVTSSTRTADYGSVLFNDSNDLLKAIHDNKEIFLRMFGNSYKK